MQETGQRFCGTTGAKANGKSAGPCVRCWESYGASSWLGFVAGCKGWVDGLEEGG